MTFDETLAVVVKVRKLKQLAAHNPNVHEGVLAAAKAEALIDRHHLRLCWSMWEQAERDMAMFADAIARLQATRRTVREKSDKAACTETIAAVKAARRRVRETAEPPR